jgi:Domain of Unknown Function (DUF928)
MKALNLVMGFGWMACELLTHALIASQVQSSPETTTVRQVSQSQGIGRSKKRKAGAKRGVCANSRKDEILTAIVPEQGDDLTSKPSPTFLFFVPDAPQPDLKATFRLQVSAKNDRSPMPVTIKNTPGIIAYRLNSPLEAGKNYDWSLEISCGKGRYQNINGTVVYKPLSRELQEKLDKAKSNKKAMVEIYQKEGLILDAVAVSAELATTDAKFWEKQLKNLDLPELIEKRVVR